MNDKKKIKIIITITILIIMLLVSIFFGVKNIYNKVDNVNKKHQQKIELINSSYNQFSVLINDFNLKRDKLNEYMSENLYYEYFSNIKDELYDFYVDYDKIIGSISNISLSLSEACKIDFVNEDIEKKCLSFKNAYEMVINIYMNDLNLYNKSVKNYNDWIGSESAIPFKSKYVTEYIDVNNDGVYSGKEV